MSKIIKRFPVIVFLLAMPLKVLLAVDNFDRAGVVVSDILAKVKENDNWKLAFLTAQSAQVVFMSVSLETNPNNEIGMEVHKFDQVIFVVLGKGKAILDGKTTMVKPGDMIFIPQGVRHNVVNLNHDMPLKIMSVYSATDIPAGAVYKSKADEPEE